MKIKLNKDKRIGKVLYLVEGEKDEVDLLKLIYKDILKYNIVYYNKANNVAIKERVSNDLFSVVYIVPMENSAISKIKSSKDYLDNIYNKLKMYDLHYDECAKYFIFDRDRTSNPSRIIKRNFSILKNSYDNDNEINGLLLLSYPSIEAFYYNCNKLNKNFKNGKEIKNDLKLNNRIKKIDVDLLKNGVVFFLNFIQSFNKNKFSNFNLDDLSTFNLELFNIEENYRNSNDSKLYFTLSTIFISLLDLGIFEYYED